MQVTHYSTETMIDISSAISPCWWIYCGQWWLPYILNPHSCSQVRCSKLSRQSISYPKNFHIKRITHEKVSSDIIWRFLKWCDYQNMHPHNIKSSCSRFIVYAKICLIDLRFLFWTNLMLLVLNVICALVRLKRTSLFNKMTTILVVCPIIYGRKNTIFVTRLASHAAAYNI